MLRNVDSLKPPRDADAEELRRRAANRERVQNAIAGLTSRGANELGNLKLEGATHADCLIECENAFLWIEGKRTDWISPGITYDRSRDQLARNLEAVWSLAHHAGKDYRLLLCHEHPLEGHDDVLVEGYRAATWTAGLPHIPIDVRYEFSRRIGTLKWAEIANEWCKLRRLPELACLPEE